MLFRSLTSSRSQEYEQYVRIYIVRPSILSDGTNSPNVSTIGEKTAPPAEGNPGASSAALNARAGAPAPVAPSPAPLTKDGVGSTPVAATASASVPTPVNTAAPAAKAPATAVRASALPGKEENQRATVAMKPKTTEAPAAATPSPAVEAAPIKDVNQRATGAMMSPATEAPAAAAPPPDTGTDVSPATDAPPAVMSDPVQPIEGTNESASALPDDAPALDAKAPIDVPRDAQKESITPAAAPADATRISSAPAAASPPSAERARPAAQKPAPQPVASGEGGYFVQIGVLEQELRTKAEDAGLPTQEWPWKSGELIQIQAGPFDSAEAATREIGRAHV